MNINSNQQTNLVPENTNVAPAEKLETKFAYYDSMLGTKYKKKNCGLFIGAMSILGGYSVAALVDQPTRNDILKGFGIGAASSLAFLWGAVGSLKPVTERSVLNIQTQLHKVLHSHLAEKKQLNESIKNSTQALEEVRSRAIEEGKELDAKANKVLQAKQEAYKKKFENLTMLLGGYLAMLGIISVTNENNNDIDDDYGSKYFRATAAFFAFKEGGSNDWVSRNLLVYELSKCLGKTALDSVQSILRQCPPPPVFYRSQGPNEVHYSALKGINMIQTNEELDITRKINDLQKRYGIDVTDDGKIVFPKLKEFTDLLPK